jgi:hypothetical protein
MSLARYLSKLGAMLGSDGKVPSAALAAGAARANFGAGAVLQVVSSVNNTQLIVNPATSFGTWLDSGSQAIITPSSSSSKILVIVQQSHFHDATGAQGTGCRINRNGVDITTELGFTTSYSGNGNRLHGYSTKVFLDSPASVSALTYKTRVVAYTSSGSVIFQYGGTESPSSITLMEIAA